MYEIKQLPQFQTKEVTGRTVTGIFAVHGNIDDGGDRSLPGSFDNIKVKGRDRVRFLWQHNSSEPPVATVDDIHEVSRKDLPPAVLAYAPEAMGGVEITRTYLDTPRGNEILAGIKAGAIDEMSYAYDATNATYEEIDGKQIRNIHEVKLYDASDVNWGMNPATVAAKGMPQAGMPFSVHSATVLAAVEEFIDRAKGLRDLRAKEGRQFSSANVARLQSLYDALAAAAGDLKALLDSTAPPKTADPDAVRKALLEFQRLQAQFNGASL